MKVFSSGDLHPSSAPVVIRKPLSKKYSRGKVSVRMITKANLTAYYYIYITIDLCASLICFSSSLCLFKCQQIANSISTVYNYFHRRLVTCYSARAIVSHLFHFYFCATAYNYSTGQCITKQRKEKTNH